MWYRLTLLLVAIVLVSAAAPAKVYSPWILSEHVADTRDEVRFARDPRWANLQGQEKALAVWRYLTDPTTGAWHYADTTEGEDPGWESRLVKDPSKTLNVYGFAVCTAHASMLEGLYEALGFGVRQMEFGGYHRTAEVEWDGTWHYLDVDERAYLVDDAGRVVSVTEATTRPELWEPSSKKVSPFYPQNGGVEGISELAKHGPGVAHWHWRTLGHSMDFTLRPGESLTRYWHPTERYRVDPSWTGEQAVKQLLEPPPGPKTAREYSVNNHHGNGRWVYAPQLTTRSRDFADGVYRYQGLTLEPYGLRPSPAGAGWAEWRVRSPYLIVGKPNDLANPQDDSGAAGLEFTATGDVTVRVSTDQGRHWETVWSNPKARGPQRLDLTKWVEGRYEYHLRIDLKGTPRGARLTALRLTTWTQLAPVSLPRLAAGVNHLSFVWGGRRGEATEVAALEPDLSHAADAARWGVKMEGKYDPARVDQRAKGPVLMKVTALEGSKLHWLHVGGSFYARRDPGNSTPDRLLFSANPQEGWRLIRQETPPDWDQHWYYNVEADLELSRPVRALWVKLDPAVAANGLRVYAHSAPDEAEQQGPVVVTHTYRVGGKELHKTFTFTRPTAYEIVCDGEPDNVAVTMSVPSQAAPKAKAHRRHRRRR